MEKSDSIAALGFKDGFSVFSFAGHVIRFKAPYSLEKYTHIVNWDNGYLVVMAKYSHNKDEEEEYIDLIPILDDLYFDAEEFLRPIEGVVIE